MTGDEWCVLWVTRPGGDVDDIQGVVEEGRELGELRQGEAGVAAEPERVEWRRWRCSGWREGGKSQTDILFETVVGKSGWLV